MQMQKTLTHGLAMAIDTDKMDFPTDTRILSQQRTLAWATREEQLLASYAMFSVRSAGRKYHEPPHMFRGPFQRDRDRVLHSSAFRRLSGKMQVFTGEMGDYHRTRLTHTHEVATIARTIGRALRLNEDLIEAFSKANLRKKIKVDGHLGPQDLGDQEKAAAGAVGNANELLAIAGAVKTMDEIVPTTRYEGDFFRALSEIALEESNHVMLRASAVEAMARASKTVVDSGLYDEKSLRLTRETVRTLAMREDVNSYFSGANLAYQAVQTIVPNSEGRKISSQGNPVPAR